jgi:hypothetical protein
MPLTLLFARELAVLVEPADKEIPGADERRENPLLGWD